MGLFFPGVFNKKICSVFLKKLNLRQQQKISLHMSVNLNSEREKNPNRLICAHLNINSVKNKFVLLSDVIKNTIDILMISETKLDSSFPNGQFQIHGYSEPYRLDRNRNSGGIPTKLIDSQMKIEGFFIELNLRRKKWLLCCSYNPKYSQISHHLKEIGKDLDVLT